MTRVPLHYILLHEQRLHAHLALVCIGGVPLQDHDTVAQSLKLDFSVLGGVIQFYTMLDLGEGSQL